MPSKRILNANLRPQESKANKFKRQFEINRLMADLDYATEMALGASCCATSRFCCHSWATEAGKIFSQVRIPQNYLRNFLNQQFFEENFSAILFVIF